MSISLLAACSEKLKETNNEKATEVSTTESMDVKMDIDSNQITVTEWKEDGSHHVEIAGHLSANGKPVKGAKIQISERRMMETGKNGDFSLTVDTQYY